MATVFRMCNMLRIAWPVCSAANAKEEPALLRCRERPVQRTALSRAQRFSQALQGQPAPHPTVTLAAVETVRRGVQTPHHLLPQRTL